MDKPGLHVRSATKETKKEVEQPWRLEVEVQGVKICSSKA
jgi:hypothetical protein